MNNSNIDIIFDTEINGTHYYNSHTINLEEEKAIYQERLENYMYYGELSIDCAIMAKNELHYKNVKININEYITPEAVDFVEYIEEYYPEPEEYYPEPDEYYPESETYYIPEPEEYTFEADEYYPEADEYYPESEEYYIPESEEYYIPEESYYFEQ